MLDFTLNFISKQRPVEIAQVFVLESTSFEFNRQKLSIMFPLWILGMLYGQILSVYSKRMIVAMIAHFTLLLIGGVPNCLSETGASTDLPELCAS